MFWAYYLMLRAVAHAWAAIALPFAFFGAVMLGCGLAQLRHSIYVESSPTQMRLYRLEREGGSWGGTVERKL